MTDDVSAEADGQTAELERLRRAFGAHARLIGDLIGEVDELREEVDGLRAEVAAGDGRSRDTVAPIGHPP